MDEFNPRKELLEISYSTPNLINDSPIRYQYKIEGLGQEWINQYSNKLSIHNLSPGSYTLSIRGPGSKNVWSDQIAQLKIFVPRPFFQSIWFYLLALLTIGVLSYAYFKRRTYNLLKSKLKLKEEVEKRTLSLQKSKEKIEEQASELSQLDRLKSNFFTNVSHELRTPLTMVINPLKKVRGKSLDNEEAKNYIETAHQAGQQLGTLVNRILKLSELETGVVAVQKKSVSILDLFQHIIIPYQQIAKDLKIQISINEIAEFSENYLLDFDKIKEIIGGILKNAINHSQEGDEIELILKYKDGMLLFSCTDQGPGISKKDQLKIFDRYYAAETNGFEHLGGLGIGLYMYHAFAKLMKGNLIVESEIGYGAKFVLTIPCQITEQASSLPNPTIEKCLQKGSNSIFPPQMPPHTVLIVEDHELMNYFLSTSLQQEFQIISAKNGKEALSILDRQSNEIDLILSDWMMPIMDGTTFLGKLKGKMHTRNIPVIMLSARAANRDKLTALRIGIDDYLTKPFDHEILKARIKNLINNYQQKKEAIAVQNREGIMPLKDEISANDKWLLKLKSNISKNLSSPTYGPTLMAQAMNISERQLSRKTAALLGISPANYLREFRLLKAENFLKQQTHSTVSEVAYSCGFSNPEYFSKVFKKRFGIKPSAILRKEMP